MKISFERDSRNIYVVADGKRVAKRGEPGTPQAGTWVIIEPGYSVRSYGGELGLDYTDVTHGEETATLH